MSIPAKRRLLRALVAVAAIYAVLSTGLFWAMSQSPERFGRIMSYVPMPAMALLPFEGLWNLARAGELKIGDLAPEFELPTSDKSGIVRLSDLRGKSPVVLVFGSYT